MRTSTKPTTPLPAMRPGFALDALWSELALQLGLDRRPFVAPAGAFERGWLLATKHAVLRYQQSQLEYSTRQQVQRLLLHGGEGGEGEVSPAAHAAGSPASPAAHVAGSPAPLAHEDGASERGELPRVRLTRRASTKLVGEQLQAERAEIEALKEEITAFERRSSTADENPAKAQQRRGADAKPRSKGETSRADEDPAKAQQRRGADAKPRSKGEMSRADEDPAKAQQRRGADAKPRSKAQINRAIGERKG